MAGEQELWGAQQAAIAAYRDRQNAAVGRRTFLGINLRKYVGFRMPGLDQTKMFSDPYCMLRNGERMRAEGRMLIWRKPDDPVTKGMCLRKTLRPILASELDPASPYANVDRVKILTADGAREVVRTPKGLGLFECPDPMTLDNSEQGQLPGQQWDHAYLAGLAETADQFSADVESLSQGSLEGRVTGSMTEKDTANEIVAR